MTDIYFTKRGEKMEIIKAAELNFIQKNDCVSYTEFARIVHENDFYYKGDILECSD